jgi:hypothetical protein
LDFAASGRGRHFAREHGDLGELVAFGRTYDKIFCVNNQDLLPEIPFFSASAILHTSFFV